MKLDFYQLSEFFNQLFPLLVLTKLLKVFIFSSYVVHTYPLHSFPLCFEKCMYLGKFICYESYLPMKKSTLIYPGSLTRRCIANIKRGCCEQTGLAMKDKSRRRLLKIVWWVHDYQGPSVLSFCSPTLSKWLPSSGLPYTWKMITIAIAFPSSLPFKSIPFQGNHI